MDFDSLLKAVIADDSISDLHLTAYSYPVVRSQGSLRPYKEAGKKYSPEDNEKIARGIMNKAQQAKFAEAGELDFSHSITGVSRFRVNAYRQRGSVSLALRIIPREIPGIDELGLPEIIKKLALQRKGLILCTGPTGSGKSTTLAAMIGLVNAKKSVHILTLEDPIEYLHNHKQSIVHQREVGLDTKSFALGLRAALRQDPDIILVGEMRDLETISIALEAAETGHLVLATLHTTDAPSTIDRVIDVFPPGQQQQVKVQLASTLTGVISQQLLPRLKSKGRVAALEVLIGTSAVKNVIREGKSHQLKSLMQTGGKYGMIFMDNYLVQLYNKGFISMEECLRRSDNPDYIKKRAKN